MFDFATTPASDSQSPPPTPDGNDAHPAEAEGFCCALCDGAMYGAHCKLICSNCGYREDCSDLFRA